MANDPVIFSRDNLIQAADDYLASIGTTLYGQAYDITQPNRRRQAAEELVNEMEKIRKQALANWYKRQTPPASSNGHVVDASAEDSN